MIRLQRDPLEVVDIVPRHARSKKARTFSSPAEAAHFLRELVLQSGSAFLVRELLSRTCRFTDLNLLSDFALVDRLAREVTYGELKVVISVRRSPMPPVAKKLPKGPPSLKPELPKPPKLPDLKLPDIIADINAKLQADVLDIAAALGIPLAEICKKSDPVDTPAGDQTDDDTDDTDDTQDSPDDLDSPDDEGDDQQDPDESDDQDEQESDESEDQAPDSEEPQADDAPSDDASSNGDASSSDDAPDAPTQPRIVKLNLTDAHFNLDSAFVLPDFVSNLVAAEGDGQPASQGLVDIGLALSLATQYPKHRILVAGHTDTSGSVEYNQPLSDDRAKAVLALVKGDRQGFVDAVTDHYGAIGDDDTKAKRIATDLQTIMTWAAQQNGWDCDPQGIDGQIGPNSRHAMDVFGQQTGVTVSVDSPADWVGAAYDQYNQFLTSEPQVTAAGGLDGCRSAVNDPPAKAAGFSKLHPLVGSPDDDTANPVNRRVEILLFPAGADGSYSFLDPEQPPVYEDSTATIKSSLASDNNWDPQIDLHETEPSSAPEASPEEESETVIVGAGYSWTKRLGSFHKVEFTLGLKIEGDVVWTGPKDQAPSAEECKAQIKEAGNKKSKAEFEAPIAEGLSSPTIEEGGDFVPFTKDWEREKGKTEKKLTIAQMQLFCVSFKTPGWKEPLLKIPVEAAAAEINLDQPLESSIGKLSGSIEVTIFDGEIPISDHLKIKGGLVGTLEASFEFLTAEDLLKKALGDSWDVLGDAAADAAGDGAATVAEDAAADAALDAGEDAAIVAGADVALTVGIVVVGVAAIAYVCYEIFESWEEDDARKQLDAAENATVAGFMDGLTDRDDDYKAHGNEPGFDKASYAKAHASGEQQRKKLIAEKCNGDKSKLDTWLTIHMDECCDEVVKQFRESARKATFEQHVKPRTGSMFDDSLGTLRDWWQATIGGDPKSTGMMSEWEKYRGSEPGDGWFSDSDEITWKGDWSSL